MRARKGRGSGESKTSPRRIDSAQRQAQALSLRKAGATYDQISKELKYNSPQAAAVSVQRALARTIQEPADEYRKIVGERLNTALRSIWPGVLRGEKTAHDSFIKIHQEIVKLYGLNKQIDINVQAEQMNVQQNIQTNVNLQFDLTKLSEEQLGQYEQLLASWSTLLTAVASGTGGAEGKPANGASASGNGHSA